MEKEENQNNSPTNKSQEAENAENDIGENKNNLQPEDISSDEKAQINRAFIFLFFQFLSFLYSSL